MEKNVRFVREEKRNGMRKIGREKDKWEWWRIEQKKPTNGGHCSQIQADRTKDRQRW